MENKHIATVLKFWAQLMELHEQNSFKIKTLTNAAFKIGKLTTRLADKSEEEIATIDGIGASTAKTIRELLEKGSIAALKILEDATPRGVIEILHIKGLGPKKVGIIWKELGIESVNDLYYACCENRLVTLKGFGAKTQQEIKQLIEFTMNNHGKLLYARAETIHLLLVSQLHELLAPNKLLYQLSVVGSMRRKCEVIDSLHYLIACNELPTIIETLTNWHQLTNVKITSENIIEATTKEQATIVFHFCNIKEFAFQQFILTGNDEHVKRILTLLNGKTDFENEPAIYQSAGYHFIEPELRENRIEFEYSDTNLISYADLKGALHNHSTWSDGIHSIKEMALYCRDQLGLNYLGICDHSRSAFYANGLNVERVREQHLEIDLLNQQLAPFKIFKGIESDILYDGSLDYPDEVLAMFDFIVASVHSNLKMDKNKATERLLNAIKNPYTTILGHPTGRLLLGRKGYEIDYEAIIDACVQHHVVLEINANPMRLDIDWRWHQTAIQKGAYVAINPDAHHKEGISDMQYGIHIARKGGINASQCLNAKNTTEIEQWFEKRKKKIA